MSRYHRSLTLALWPVLVGFMLGSSAFSQTTRSSSPAGISSCDEFTRTGRPTLKRRGQPQSSASSVAEQKAPIKCRNPQDGTLQHEVSLRFVGLTAFRELDAIKLMREARVGLRPDLLPDVQTAEKAAEVLKKLLSTKGYVYAVVNPIRDEQFNSVTFQVTEGERVPLADIRFEGTKVFPADQLTIVTTGCLSRFKNSKQGFDQELLEYCLRNTSNYVRNQGYLQAKFDEPKIEVIGNGIVAIVRVEEGLLYRLGRVELDGADRVSAEEIRAMLPLSQGDVVGSDSIGKWLFEDLKKSYGELGYIEYTAEPIPEFRKLSEIEGVVDFKVIIEEGDRFTLRSLEFEGEVLPTAKFINESPLQPGDVYKASAYAAFVKQLNQSGLFEPIDQDRDGDFRLNHEERVVSIRLKLRRRGN
jgi:outer membrane protein insertion porin family